eukprot:CAMPEP_0115494746 /NCGR_PEP_ID=MMETSP0271-20121206/64883_1 /TAXON_ID=71861 /ORGANISM="Scrippsiella trochoidea, Strain CCMP3099" /LENGTH=33 /DNA_ID= /DNA_START= /DNA_END= /DNA_ORIENTATION=
MTVSTTPSTDSGVAANRLCRILPLLHKGSALLT